MVEALTDITLPRPEFAAWWFGRWERMGKVRLRRGVGHS